MIPTSVIKYSQKNYLCTVRPPKKNGFIHVIIKTDAESLHKLQNCFEHNLGTQGTANKCMQTYRATIHTTFTSNCSTKQFFHSFMFRLCTVAITRGPILQRHKQHIVCWQRVKYTHQLCTTVSQYTVLLTSLRLKHVFSTKTQNVNVEGCPQTLCRFRRLLCLTKRRSNILSPSVFSMSDCSALPIMQNNHSQRKH
jgi:hypothetical protein